MQGGHHLLNSSVHLILFCLSVGGGKAISSAVRFAFIPAGLTGGFVGVSGGPHLFLVGHLIFKCP